MGAVSGATRRERRSRRRAKEIVAYRRICTYRSGTGREYTDVSGTLVCDERADTQESDPVVDRAVLVFVGFAVSAAGHASPGPCRPRRGHLRAGRQCHRSAAPGADWENGPEGALDSFFVGRDSEAPDQRQHLLHRWRLEGRERHPVLGGSPTTRSPTRTSCSTPTRPFTRPAATPGSTSGPTGSITTAPPRSVSGSSRTTSASANGDFFGDHVDGDVLIISEYTNGGVVSSICAYEWDGSGRRRQH